MEYINFEHNETAAELVRAAYDTPPLAFVHSYGCQQNVNDGERIKGVLVDIGYGLCDKPEDADLILFNTCAVREHAEQRVFGNVGALKGLKEKKHDLIIGLCGCMANQKHVVEKLRQSYPYVDLVFGVDGIDTLPLHPRRAMRHIVGPLAKLVEHPADTGDYIWATLTDPTPQPDAMAMLRTAYPNAMRLDYRPQGAEILPADTAQSVRGKPFASLFEDFFTQMNGRPLTVEEARAVKALREEASK